MPSVRFATPLKGIFAAVSVSDDGCGIDASVTTHVFDPFFTTKGEGEGEEDVESTVGEGSTFGLYLPLTHQTPAAVGTSETQSLHDAKGLNVLVVEDNVDVAAFAVPVSPCGN
jgi:K+-sensing histidine kinase KdpD